MIFPDRGKGGHSPKQSSHRSNSKTNFFDEEAHPSNLHGCHGCYVMIQLSRSFQIGKHPGCQDLSGLRAGEIAVSRLIATLGPLLGSCWWSHCWSQSCWWNVEVLIVLAWVLLLVVGWDQKKTQITTAGIPPSHPRYLYEKLIYKDAIVAHPGVSMSGGLRLGYWSGNRLWTYGPPEAQFSQFIMKHSSFSCWITKKLYSTTKLQKRYTTNSCFFSSWPDASPIWIHIDFLWDVALPPCHPLGPRLGNVWFRLGETGHDQHLGVRPNCWGLHSGQTLFNTGKFEALFVLGACLQEVFWGFLESFSLGELRHVRRSWLCWRSYLSHHLR